jgi:hypothetical protein
MVNKNATVTVAEKVILSRLTSKPAGGVTRIPAVITVPDTLKLIDGEGVPYVVVKAVKVPDLLIVPAYALNDVINKINTVTA